MQESTDKTVGDIVSTATMCILMRIMFIDCYEQYKQIM